MPKDPATTAVSMMPAKKQNPEITIRMTTTAMPLSESSNIGTSVLELDQSIPRA